VPVAAIVGYTNAGKSTLLNALTRSDVLAEDKLFATLDTTSRQMRFPDARELVLTDTVGFIERLPKDLLQAFKATLEELGDADLLIHVIDASDPHIDLHRRVVEEVIEDLDLQEIPVLVVLNKADLLGEDELALRQREQDGVGVSATTRQGLDVLMKAIEQAMWRQGRGDLKPDFVRAQEQWAAEAEERAGES
jgi:GTP-binding protein HflX